MAFPSLIGDGICRADRLALLAPWLALAAAIAGAAVFTRRRLTQG